MKIALCFFGYFGKQNISYKLYQLNGYSLNDYNEMWSIENFKKNIIQNYDVNIFFHCWNQDSESQNLLINEYQPKDYLFEKQYNHKFHIWRFYSESKCINLMNKYEFKLLHKKHNDDMFSEQSKFKNTYNYIFKKLN